MPLLDLKRADPFQFGLDRRLSPAEVLRMRRELPFYDEYYLTSSGNVIKIFRQGFMEDPYMDLPPMEEIRLMDYQSGTSLDDLVEVAAMADCPVITRVLEGDSIPGFSPILNRCGKPTRLLPFKFLLPYELEGSPSPFVREIQSNDVQTVREWFREGYSLRFRMIDLLFREDQSWCHVFESGGVLMGVVFSRLDADGLYLRQVFVPEKYRFDRIGESLYRFQFSIAFRKGVNHARGNVREETYDFQKKMGGDPDDTLPSSIYVIKQ